MGDSITLNISTNAHERVIKQWLQDTLRQFNSGDLSLNQTRDLIMGYFDQTKALAQSPQTQPAREEVREALEKLTGAMRFILAFYEPGQRHLDTNAWKSAEATARSAFVKAEAALAQSPKAQEGGK